MKDVSDAELVETGLLERARRFDPEALRALHDRFYAPVYRYVHFKVADPQSSEDLTSEVFVRVLEALKRGMEWRTTPAAWIFGIARHVVADHYRKRMRQAEVELDDGLTMPGEDGPIARVVVAEEYEALAKAIGSLTDEQRDVILMRFMEGLSIQDVAAALDKTPGAIKGLQHRALRALSHSMLYDSSEDVAGGGL